MGGLPRGRVFVAVQHSLATATREPEQISKGILLPSVFLLSQKSRVKTLSQRGCWYGEKDKL